MAETLTTQELSALQEMPSTPEMRELRKIVTLHDIPLAEGDNMQQFTGSHQNSQQENEAEKEHKLKTSSLKRFFRLSPKKKAGDGPLEAETTQIELEQEGVKMNELQQNSAQNMPQGDDMNLKETSSEYKRFKLGFGRYESNSPTNVLGQKELSASFSKATLKSSLSTYWNSVFKLKKGKKNSKSHMELESNVAKATTSDARQNETPNSPNDNQGNNDCVSEDNSVLEEIQSLKISDECPRK